MPDGAGEDVVQALLGAFPSWLALLPVLVPLAVIPFKLLNHHLAGWVYPLLAVLLGILVCAATAVVLDLPRWDALGLGLGLGLAGVGVREVVDQLWQALSVPLGLDRWLR